MSDTPGPKDRDKLLLKQTLDLIARHEAGYRPTSYAVWYGYADGRDPGLRTEVDRAIESRGHLTEEVNDDLYLRYMATAAERTLLRARLQLEKTLGDTREDLQATGSDTARFHGEVGDFGRQLADPADLAKLRGDVARIAERSGEVSGSLSGLNDKLKASREEVVRLEEELTRLQQEALTDALTGLSNRRGFDLAVAQLPDAAVSSVCVLMCDIDHFKRINDTYGHPFGDQVLRGVAQVIRALLGAGQIAARFGGEEFAVLVPGTSAEGAALAERIRRQIEASRIRRAGDTQSHEKVTISIGVAQRQVGEPLEALVGRADAALYRAKQGGRNRVELDAAGAQADLAKSAAVVKESA